MKILDLSAIDDFNSACLIFKKELSARFPEPDLIVGIANGGAQVVKHMDYDETKVIVIKRQRTVTKVKSSLEVGTILGALPTPVNNALRVLEVVLREIKFALLNNPLERGDISIVSGDYHIKADIRNILIIDDAIDSGATFLDVGEYIRKAFPTANIVTAALCQTFKKPALEIDFVLHKRTLIRGPWSFDAKPNQKNINDESST